MAAHRLASTRAKPHWPALARAAPGERLQGPETRVSVKVNYPVTPRRATSPHGHAAAAVLVMHDQSIMSCIFSQASSCGKLSCMIDADHMPIRHVSGDLHFADVFHEVIISSCR